MRIDLTLTQVTTLEAAAAGTLYHRADDHLTTGSRLGVWRIELGRAVMMSALVLLDRGLIAEGTPLPDGRIPAVITELGQAVLDELASREPRPTTPRERS